MDGDDDLGWAALARIHGLRRGATRDEIKAFIEGPGLYERITKMTAEQLLDLEHQLEALGRRAR